MKTKEQILDKNGFDFEAFKFENEYSADNILLAMEEYAQQKVEQLSNQKQLLPIIEKVFGWGCAVICKERKRQIDVEGFTPNSDYEKYWGNEELATAGALYAMPLSRRDMHQAGVPHDWPWSIKWWKPTPNNRTRELEKGGALTAAEIDRLKRKEESK